MEKKEAFLKARPLLTQPRRERAGPDRRPWSTCGGRGPSPRAQAPGARIQRRRPPGVALLRRRGEGDGSVPETSRRQPDRAAPASASPAPARRAPNKPQTRPGERRPTATAGAGEQGPAGRARRPAHAAEGDGCPPTWRCVRLWRARADARSRHPPTPRGQPPGQRPPGSAAAAGGGGREKPPTPQRLARAEGASPGRSQVGKARGAKEER